MIFALIVSRPDRLKWRSENASSFMSGTYRVGVKNLFLIADVDDNPATEESDRIANPTFHF